MSNGSLVNHSIASDSLIESIGDVILVPVELIRPFADQPRKHFDLELLRYLEDSLRGEGQVHPGLVIEIDEDEKGHRYELVDGERRWQVLQLISRTSRMKVIVVKVGDKKEQFLMSVIANFGGQDHSPLEIARAIKSFRANGMTQERVAAFFSQSISWVRTRENLLNLTPEVQKLMAPELPRGERLLLSHAVAISELAPDLQDDIAERVVGRGLRIGETRALVGSRASNSSFAKKKAPSANYRKLFLLAQRTPRMMMLFAHESQETFNEMFASRDADDACQVIENLDAIIAQAEALKKLVQIAEDNRKISSDKED